ncbi:hypothetical protein ES703_93493 [subsurface metagenome]
MLTSSALATATWDALSAASAASLADLLNISALAIASRDALIVASAASLADLLSISALATAFSTAPMPVSISSKNPLTLTQSHPAFPAKASHPRLCNLIL